MFARDLDKPLTIKRGPLHKGNIMDLSVAAHGPNFFFFYLKWVSLQLILTIFPAGIMMTDKTMANL